MFTSKNEYINTNEIIYVRHIKQLPAGYDKTVYPEYSLYMPNNEYITIEKFDLKIPEFYKLEDDTTNHPCVLMGYPKDCKITYYIDLTKIVSAFTGSSSGYSKDDYLKINFTTRYSLIIYNKEQYEALLKVLKNY